MTYRRLFFFLPLLVFAVLAVFLARNLGHPQQAVIKSQMVGKPMPEFDLPGLTEDAPGLSRADLVDGQLKLVNIFASWCLPCAVEAPQMKALADQGIVIHGIAIQDAPEDSAAFLAKYGNPYARVAADRDGRMLVALGASGVPETYVIDGKGVIREQHLGDIRPEHLAPLIARMEQAKSAPIGKTP